MIIGNLDTEREALLVAEIGNNHEGSFATAQELVRRAAAAGVRAVKFQTFRTENYVSRADAERFQRLKSFELTYAQFRELSDLAHSHGLAFLSTPFDLESARQLEPIVDAYKIASGDNDYYPLLRAVCRTKKPIIVSTGLADLEHVRRVVAFIREQWSAIGHSGSLAMLHCVSCYPVPAADANLRAITTMAESLDCEVGYSDHTQGVAASIIAATLGARIIEKHFTLSKSYSSFRDHQLSADPEEMAFLVSALRDVPALLGDGLKTPQACELASRDLMRRSIVAASDLPAGHPIALEDLDWIRPRRGLAPGDESLLVGRRLTRAVNAGEPISVEMIEP